MSYSRMFSHYIPEAAGGAADQEPSLIEGKLVNYSLLLRHLVHTLLLLVRGG